jgi:formaldehyde-activating enzyme involved in methanogenesis
MKIWKLLSGLGGLAVVAAVLGVWLFGGTSVASASEMSAADLGTLTQSTTGPGLLGDGYLAHGGWGGRGGFMFPPFGDRTIDYHQLLADALGITVDELEIAFAEAREAALAQAVEEGLITQEQADDLLVRGLLGGKGFGGMRDFRGLGGPMGRGFRGISDSTIDENALLADALGITVEELQGARETANQAAIAQALEEGLITQEQVDQMQARRDLQSYLDREALMAAALGMTVEELQTALAEGKTFRELMSELELDMATMRENVQAAFEAVLAQAVEDGVITQEQADAMKDGAGRGFGMGPLPLPEGFQGKGGFRGRGGFGGRWPLSPGTDDDTSGTGFRRPGRTTQDANAL